MFYFEYNEFILWVNPDFGLKTRGWTETKLALENRVNAAKQLRKEYQA
nr:hypothetical protein [Colwellia sp. TT2012]